MENSSCFYHRQSWTKCLAIREKKLLFTVVSIWEIEWEGFAGITAKNFIRNQLKKTKKRKSYRSIKVNTTSWGNFITNFYRVCCIYFVFLWFITSSIDVQTSLPIINSRLNGSRYLSLADLLLHIIFVLWVILIQLNRTFYLFMPLSATYWNLSLIFLLLSLCIIIQRTLINSFHLHLVGA